MSAGIDVAVRIGELKDSSLIARQIGLTRRRVFAALSYLEGHGVPSTPKDLTEHNCLVFNPLEHFASWRFEHNGRWNSVQVSGNVRSNNSEAASARVRAFTDYLRDEFAGDSDICLA